MLRCCCHPERSEGSQVLAKTQWQRCFACAQHDKLCFTRPVAAWVAIRRCCQSVQMKVALATSMTPAATGRVKNPSVTP